MDPRTNSDGGVSPTGFPPVPGNANQSRLTTPAIMSDPWNHSARATSFGLGNGTFARPNNNGGLRPVANPFQPTANDVRGDMRFLSIGTYEVDQAPTIVTSAPAQPRVVQQPIGTKSSSTNTSPVYPKAWFTTDVDPNKPPMGGRFMLITGIKNLDAPTGLMAYIEKTYQQDIRGKKVINQGETADVILFIDDVRTAFQMFAQFECEGQVVVSFVGHDWYSAGKGVRIGSVDPKSMYVGQLTVTAEFKGRTSDYDKNVEIRFKVQSLVQNFGSVMAFEESKSAPFPLYQFRVEYCKVTAAEHALAQFGANGLKLEGVSGWYVSAKQYAPPTYSPVASSCEPDFNALQVVGLPPGAHIQMSTTGRTAWYTDPHGIDHPVQPPRPVANVHRDWSVEYFHGAEPMYHGAPPQAQRSLNAHLGRQPQHSVDSAFHGVQGNEVALYQDHNARPQDIVPSRIYEGQDVRTTIMLRNIPHDWQWWQLKNMLDEACAGRYNFMYLRIDFKENKNVGYAFVNFETSLDICDVHDRFFGKQWEEHKVSHFGRPKYVQMSYATIQGLDSLIDKFRNSSIMDELADYRPMLFQTVSEKNKDEQEASQLRACGRPVPRIVEIGERKEFPAPNNRAKKERSTANAGQIGLFSPRTNRPVAGSWSRSQYDRGNPAQIREDHGFGAPFAGPSQPAHPVGNYSFGAPRFPAAFPPNGGIPFQHQLGYGYMPAFPARPLGLGMPLPPSQPSQLYRHHSRGYDGGLGGPFGGHQPN